LTYEEAAARLEEVGYNELPSTRKRGITRIILEIAREPMFLLLVICGSLYLVLGDVEEALMLLGFVFVVMGITIYQERKTERALDALRDLSSPRALVIRGGDRQRIAGREVVPGDLVILREGDRVPADCGLLWGLSLSCDESLLTGESVPVRKIPAETVTLPELGGDPPAVPSDARPGGDDLPYLFSGSLVSHGEGVALVFSTGLQTELGKIGKALSAITEEQTSLQRETARIVRIAFITAALLCGIVVLVYGFVRTQWLEGVLSGITLAMAMLPEEFPVVLTIFLALGAHRISKNEVLTRRMNAVETLGAATILCSDKTGTLTENRMSIQELSVLDGSGARWSSSGGALPERFHSLVEFGILASKRDPFDPMERALTELGRSKLSATEHLHPDLSLIEEYPLTRELLALSQVWPSPDGAGIVVSAKGAPEAIADLCHLPDSEKTILSAEVERMAGNGLRVLGVAKSHSRSGELPGSQHDFDFELVGLVGLSDPVRESVPPAIQECYRAGMKVIMITGDYPSTARNIAQQVGLENCDDVITGAELEAMSREELGQRIRTVRIFARVVPEQKLSIVRALRANGEVVAMTGDGVNDAPALKAAHIGIAMGERGTDVARESAGLVLLKDDFASIVAAVRIGRRIYDNLRKAMTYIISVHIPIAGISLLPVILGWPIILHPVHIVFLELIIDPACSVVFEQEPAEGDIMSRRPRRPTECLFNARMLGISLLQGLVSLLLVAGVFVWARSVGAETAVARTCAFVTLIVSNLGLILSNRAWSTTLGATIRRGNTAFRWVLGGAVLFLSLVLFVPALRSLFLFAPIPLNLGAVSLAAGAAGVVLFEGAKLIPFRRKVAGS
ncbi:MAG TPA: HAD-IC family P-type ATPase, partial [Spirochaetia bacterium]|nr:HAD-IC family P-type ATPase [Spirochaetia bacterium]